MALKNHRIIEAGEDLQDHQAKLLADLSHPTAAHGEAPVGFEHLLVGFEHLLVFDSTASLGGEASPPSECRKSQGWVGLFLLELQFLSLVLPHVCTKLCSPFPGVRAGE